MKAALVVALFAASALAQEAPAIAPACGPMSVHFDVKLDKTQHPVTQPEPGKARVYFIQDIGFVHVDYIGKQPETRFGIDGRWNGATLGNSYIAMSVEPGEHHVCANPQMGFRFGRQVELAHFTAESGETYYFRKRFITTQEEVYLLLDRLDSDEGEHLIRTLPMSVSTMKK
jgi:hypothetical protein